MNLEKNNEKLVPFGIWTPKAKILCHECHGNVFPRGKYDEESGKFEDLVMDKEEFKKACSPKSLGKNKEITKCNKCNKEIQVYDSIAYENNLCIKLKDNGVNASMAQTSGMNSAIEIPTRDDGFILISHDSSYENEWYLVFCDKEGEYLDKDFMTYDEDEIFKYILNLDCLV